MADPSAAIPFTPCHLAAPGLPGRVAAECGTFDVPEDRSRPMGEDNRIALRVARLPAVSRSPAPDAMTFLAGGPGQAATESYVALAGALSSINRKRDILLIDQRGTGGSNALACPEAEARLAERVEAQEAAVAEAAEEDAAALAEREDRGDAQVEEGARGGETSAQPGAWDPSMLREMAGACLDELPGDPRFYTTDAAVADLEAVRAALGYAQLDLVGVSYGTRVAQRYLATHPERVRVLVLDGVVPPDLVLGIDVATVAQAALDDLHIRCAEDPACAGAFGDPGADFEQVLSRLEDEAARVRVTHPTTGEAETMRLTRETAAGATRLLLYAPETAALLPWLFDAAERGDYAPLAAQSLLVGEALDASITTGLSYAVSCAEDAPFLDAETIAAGAEGSFLGAQVGEALLAICGAWPEPTSPTVPAVIAPTGVPALLLSGAVDPVTPPAHADRAAASLTNALHVVAPGQGHNVVARGCLPRLVTAFVEEADTAALDPSCVETMGPPPFLLGPAGPYREVGTGDAASEVLGP